MTRAHVASFEQEVRRRRDQSFYVTHFTKDRGGQGAGDVLRSILRERRIRATPVGDRCGGGGEDCAAVCLTEAPLLGLIVPTAPRSPAHGIGFGKPFVYGRGGMPALHVRRDLLELDGTAPVAPALRPFVKPFDIEEENKTYEREWRLPADLAFRLEDVAYVIVPRAERPSFSSEFPAIPRLLDYEFLLEAG